MGLPEPDHSPGHAEAQVRALLGDEYARFHGHMLMKTTARDANGLVFYDVDLRWYLAVQDRRKAVAAPPRKVKDDQDHHVPASR